MFYLFVCVLFVILWDIGRISLCVSYCFVLDKGYLNEFR